MKPAAVQPVGKQDEREPSLAERLQAERERLFGAMSIINAVAASAQSVEAEGDPELGVDALRVAHDLVDRVASELEAIADEHGGVNAALPEVRP